MIGILARGIDGMRHRARSLRHHRRLDFLLDRYSELCVLPHVIGSSVDAVSHAVLLRGVQRKADILLGVPAALMGRSCSVALKSHHSHAALIAGRITAVSVKRP